MRILSSCSTWIQAEGEANLKEESNPQKSSISGVFVIGAWLSILFILVIIYSEYLAKQRHPNIDAEAVSDSSGYTLVLQQNRQGHYLLDGLINGETVTFLLDTGATSVSIPAHLATRLGLESGRPFPVMTANGTVTVYETKVPTLILGNIPFNNVQAHLNPGMRSDKILLGMNVLKDLQFTQTNQQLTITIPR